MQKYDNSFKYKMIQEMCNGKSSSEIKREYSVSEATVMKWLRDFIKNEFLMKMNCHQKKILNLNSFEKKQLNVKLS
ncbi:MAG: helix-turn-helix domain-containing protein [bacterium]|nr:helix-turn-helix domain-containing protein [bacterium]